VSGKGHSNRTTRFMVFALATAVLFGTSCERYTRVPQSSWADVDSSGSKKWKITTSDRSYRVRRFTAVDSILVIQQLSRTPERHKSTYRTGPPQDVVEPVELPIMLPFEDVVSVERIDISYKRTILLPLVIFVSLWVALIFYG